VRCRYLAEPHPHIVIDELVSPELYERLRFPDELLMRGAAWGMTGSDPAYRAVLGDPGWAALHEELCGEPFVRFVLETFATDMRAHGCLVDPSKARLTGFVESREQKELRVLAREGDPAELYTRLDFQMKGAGAYRQFVHLDWPRRIVGGILFLCDADEEQMVGGELAFYRDRAFGDDRWCHDPELVAAFTPRHNTGVVFLNTNRAFHGPCEISRLAGVRRWLYYTISSRLDIWPHAERTA
jgi:hypothetical protein